MLSLLLFWAPDLRADGGLRLEITHPVSGSRVENRAEQAFVSGTAAASGVQQAAFDVVLVIDISQSTGIASGSDIDRDGEIGVNPHRALPNGVIDRRVLSTDPDDSVFKRRGCGGQSIAPKPRSTSGKDRIREFFRRVSSPNRSALTS